MKVMHPKVFLLRIMTVGLIGFGSLAQAATPLQTLKLTVDGIARTALVYVPPDAGTAKLPLVFIFHGHGQHAPNAVASYKIDQLWPEAISVYPEGVNTALPLYDPKGTATGWQALPGTFGDRDLHFFDALLAEIEKEHTVDPVRVYCTGVSNGAFFTYLLWLTRTNVFAAVAPCSGFADATFATQLPPKPAIISGGSQDKTVDFALQKATMDTVIKTNGCDPAGTPWENQTGATLYTSSSGTPLVTFIFPGGHSIPATEPGLIVKFFKEHPGATASPAPAP